MKPIRIKELPTQLKNSLRGQSPALGCSFTSVCLSPSYSRCYLHHVGDLMRWKIRIIHQCFKSHLWCVKMWFFPLNLLDGTASLGFTSWELAEEKYFVLRAVLDLWLWENDQAWPSVGMDLLKQFLLIYCHLSWNPLQLNSDFIAQVRIREGDDSIWYSQAAKPTSWKEKNQMCIFKKNLTVLIQENCWKGMKTTEKWNCRFIL